MPCQETVYIIIRSTDTLFSGAIVTQQSLCLHFNISQIFGHEIKHFRMQ